MNMFTIGLILKATDMMSSVVNSAAQKSQTSLQKLEQKFRSFSQASERFARASAANGMMLAGIIRAPIQAFADLDEASTNLRVAMMDSTGAVASQFAEINRQAVELGNKLPGTTADFVNAATALIENGTALEQVVNGGLRASSYLSVILKMPARDAAEMTAKFRESFGLAEHELVKMADLTQRAKFAFGLDPSEIKYAAQYQGATLNALHLTGANNAKLMLAFQGYARQRGMEGSVFGTNFAQMLNQVGMLSDKLARHSKPMREVNKELAQYGINLEFFDKKGKFMGLENLMAQMSKLRVLTEQQRLHVNNRLFGMEGGRVASLAIDMGPEGLKKNLGLMDRQADLMKRIDVVTKSAKNTWEAFTGTVTNLFAAIGGPAVEALYPLINQLNDLTGGPLQKFVEEHKSLVKWVGLGAITIAGAALALGGIGMVASTISSGIGALISVFSGLCAGVKVVANVVMWAGRLMMTNPIVAIVGAIALAAYLIYEYWGPIKDFFKRVWKAVDEVFEKYKILNFIFPIIGIVRFLIKHWSEIVPFFQRVWKGVDSAFEKYPILNFIMPVIGAVRLITKNWDTIKPYFEAAWEYLKGVFDGGITSVLSMFADFSPIGILYRVWAKVLSYLGIDLPPKFSDALGIVINAITKAFDIASKLYDMFREVGRRAIDGLVSGLKAFAMDPVQVVMDMGGKLINGFKGVMGIKSPSRVFMQLGAYIAEGTAIGVKGAANAPARAVASMGAGAVRAGRSIAPAGRGGAVTFSPTINVNGGAGDVKAAVSEALSIAQREFEAMLRRVESSRMRTAY